MNIDGIGTEIPEEINVHKQIWGKNVEEAKIGITSIHYLFI
jgi:hypothetical protein